MYEKEIAHYLHTNGFEATRLKAVLFDMDGVLFDSMPNHAHAWSAAMTELGLPMTPEEAYLHEGRTGNGTINILTQRYWSRDVTPEEAKRIYQAKSDIFNRLPEAGQMPGAAELLQQVKASGCTPVLVTGSAQKSLIERLNLNFPHIFAPERMVTGFDVRHGKPHPEPYLMGLERAGVAPWEALVVENAPLGVQAATAAHIFTVAVNTGPLPDEVLLEAGANVLFPSVQALCDGWPHLLASLA